MIVDQSTAHLSLYILMFDESDGVIHKKRLVCHA